MKQPLRLSWSHLSKSCVLSALIFSLCYTETSPHWSNAPLRNPVVLGGWTHWPQYFKNYIWHLNHTATFLWYHSGEKRIVFFFFFFLLPLHSSLPGKRLTEKNGWLNWMSTFCFSVNLAKNQSKSTILQACYPQESAAKRKIKLEKRL